MKKWFMLIVLFAGLAVTPQKSYAVVGSPGQQALTKKKKKKQKRLEKKLDRLERKAKKRAAKRRAKPFDYDLWDDGNFRLGVLMVLAALALGLVGSLGIFSGLFNFLGGIFLLAGLILVVIAIVSNA